ncbi:chorismate synthase [Streptococcus iniae]|uniref:chorismate synthase n=1 Tax=Streptococcus iniae TaxID=1346 RepID=UPI000EF703F6|nr:chorismate synthase [Streptococcus iniae]RLV18099.1 chorismate synthase [Streptococcus iniae]
MRYLTAGESHGPSLTGIIEGIPAGLDLSEEDINKELKRRQGGYGRGARMSIENDKVILSSGVRHGKTTGTPITLTIINKDHQKWLDIMAVGTVTDKVKSKRKVTQPRPGHADLVGGMKYRYDDLRNSLERSSARETAMRVAIGALAKKVLADLDIYFLNHVLVFGGIRIEICEQASLADVQKTAFKSDLSIANPKQEAQIKAYIDSIKKEGDTIGGKLETIVSGLPAGLGSFVHWDKKLDGKIAQAVVSINAFKGVEFGMGFDMASKKGSEVMDDIIWDQVSGYSRASNNLGGFEGGVTNGQPLVIRAVMKPIPTLYKPLMSVDIETHQAKRATVERSDPTALPAAGVVMENVIATVILSEILDKFPSDNMVDLRTSLESYRDYIRSY